MNASAFPVAPTAEAALHAPAGAAVREGEAARIAQGPVALATEVVGPAFATRDAAAEAYAPRLAEPWCALRPVTPGGAAPPPVRPLADGPRRWPERAAAPALWRLQVTYWRSAGEDADAPPLAPARRARRDAASATLDGGALRRLSVQLLQAVRPQQPLDIGLFEARAPERPDLILPDD